MKEDVIIVGGGPCGLSAAIALQNEGCKPLVIEKRNVVHTLSSFPTHQTFFSTPEKLAIGGVPFIIEERKPKRNQALAYYREVTKLKKIRLHTYETVNKISKLEKGLFEVHTTTKNKQSLIYHTPYVIIATGYYDHPQYMNIPGENLPKVSHYFKEAHPYFEQDVVVIGGKNSAVDATLELEKAGARVTVLYRGTSYSDSVKPWILPEFISLVRHNKIKMEFGATVQQITEDQVIYKVGQEQKEIANDFVFAMTGYHPDHTFLKQMGIRIEEQTGRPLHHAETMESNVQNIFIAGVIAAGNDANEIFIENGRFHGELIAAEIKRRENLKRHS